MVLKTPGNPDAPDTDKTTPGSLIGNVNNVASMMGVSQKLQDAASAMATGGDLASQVLGKLRQRVDALQALGKWGRKRTEIGKGLLKIGRGIVGLVGSTFVGMAAAVSGIPAAGAHQLTYGFTENFPFTAASRKLFADTWKNLRKDVNQEWGKKKWYEKYILEPSKRFFQFLSSPLVTGVGSGAIVLAKDIVQGARTMVDGTKELNEHLKKLEEFQAVTSLLPIDKFLSIAGNVEDAAKMAEEFLSNASTTNAFGRMANWIYQKASGSETFKKLFSESTLKRLDTFAKATVGFLGGTVDKAALVAAATDAAQDVGSDFAKRMGVSEKTLTNLQAMRQSLQIGLERLQKGDYVGAATNAFQTFGFDIKKITGGQDLMKVAAQVQSTFTQAITQFTQVQKYIPGTDFETVKVGVTNLLGFQGDALTKFQDGIKKTLGEKGEAALGQTFETIRAKGDKMVNAAKDFVENLKKTKPELGEKMGFTMAAGNLDDALKALLDQKAAPDFIEKIHTFNIVDNAGQVLRNLSGPELEKFKHQAMQKAAELLPAVPQVPRAT